MNGKKSFVLGITILILFVSLVGCNKTESISFVATDVENIDVFTGSVPARARKKTVTDVEDINKIITALNVLTIVREATDDDSLSGGIGMQFCFHLSNGDNYVIKNHGNLLHTSNGSFVVKGASLSTDKCWLSLNYEEISVAENELPVIETR
jgi:hypothetical protein